MTSHETNNCKKVWTYWEGNIPSIVKDCFATWELHLCRYGWEITILSPEDIMKFDTYDLIDSMIQIGYIAKANRSMSKKRTLQYFQHGFNLY